jgi:hypothetical protein
MHFKLKGLRERIHPFRRQRASTTRLFFTYFTEAKHLAKYVYDSIIDADARSAGAGIELAIASNGASPAFVGGIGF